MTRAWNVAKRRGKRRATVALARRVVEHVFQFVDAIVGQGGDAFFVSGVGADDGTLAEIVVVLDNVFQHFEVLAEHLRDVFDGADMPDSGHHAASASETAFGVQFQGNSSSRRGFMWSWIRSRTSAR